MFIRKILIPTDFSPCAQDAAIVGIEVAKRAGAEVLFLHLSEKGEMVSHVPRPALAKAPAALLGYEKNALNELVKKAEKEGVNAFPMLVMNAGNKTILDYVLPHAVSMIVMGSHGATGIREFIWGSHTQKVVKNARIPVLVVKHVPDQIGFKNILFASEFKEGPRQGIERILDFANLWKAKLHFLYVNTEPELVTEEVATQTLHLFAAQFPGKVATESVAETNDVEFGISQFAHESGADLIAITTHEKSAIWGLFTSSIAEKLVNHQELPLLVVPEP
jgi:nucleotide-binding universal stress UspA family protein